MKAIDDNLNKLQKEARRKERECKSESYMASGSGIAKVKGML